MRKGIGLAAAGAKGHFFDSDDQAQISTGNGPGLDLVAHWMQQSWEPNDPLWRQV